MTTPTLLLASAVITLIAALVFYWSGSDDQGEISLQDIDPDQLSEEHADKILTGDLLEKEFKDLMDEDSGKNLRDPLRTRKEYLTVLIEYIAWKTYKEDLEWKSKDFYYEATGILPPIYDNGNGVEIRFYSGFSGSITGSRGRLVVLQNEPFGKKVMDVNVWSELGKDKYKWLLRWAENGASLKNIANEENMGKAIGEI